MKRLAEVLAELAGLGDGQAEALERLGLLDDPGHLGLDGREVVLGERARAGQIDVVVEAVAVVGPKASRAPGKSRRMARAMMCAVEWRRTSSASRSREVSSRSSIGSPGPFSKGRSRSTIVPSATAATAASASRLPIPSAISRGRTPSGYSLTDPSGSLICTIDRLRPWAGLHDSDPIGDLPPTHNAGTGAPIVFSRP